jgi:hypothetical protein
MRCSLSTASPRNSADRKIRHGSLEQRSDHESRGRKSGRGSRVRKNPHESPVRKNRRGSQSRRESRSSPLHHANRHHPRLPRSRRSVTKLAPSATAPSPEPICEPWVPPPEKFGVSDAARTRLPVPQHSSRQVVAHRAVVRPIPGLVALVSTVPHYSPYREARRAASPGLERAEDVFDGGSPGAHSVGRPESQLRWAARSRTRDHYRTRSPYARYRKFLAPVYFEIASRFCKVRGAWA